MLWKRLTSLRNGFPFRGSINKRQSSLVNYAYSGFAVQNAAMSAGHHQMRKKRGTRLRMKRTGMFAFILETCKYAAAKKERIERIILPSTRENEFSPLNTSSNLVILVVLVGAFISKLSL